MALLSPAFSLSLPSTVHLLAALAYVWTARAVSRPASDDAGLAPET